MAAIWYYKLMGETYGPFTANELRQKAAAGEITPDAWVRKGHDAKWTSADRVSGLFGPPTSRTAAPKPAKVKAQPPPVVPSAGGDEGGRKTASSEVSSKKNCPFCAEEIALAARKCKHCGEYLDVATPPPVPDTDTPTSSGPEQTIWEGHPSALYYLGCWILSVLLLPLGIALLTIGIGFLFIGIALIPVVYAILDQKTKVFTHTKKRVISHAGIISRVTHEVNLADVRSISMRQTLSERLFGLGTVQVCSAGHAGIEVEFAGIESPAKVRDAIRQSKDHIFPDG